MTTSSSGGPAAPLRPVVDGQLALPARVGHVALLLAALIMITVIGSLWMTEAALPLRTQLAFGAMVVIGLSWVGYALWALTYRHALLARHQIIAGRMAVTFTGVFLTGAAGAAVMTGAAAAYAAAATGLVMVVGAVIVLVRAHRAFDRLVARRGTLERELGVSARSTSD
ncbi:MAG: hypothetical protein WBD07_03615 [Vicinamibacterales bacterium]